MAATIPPTSLLYPTPSISGLKVEYVGKHIRDVQAPAVILDEAVIRRNCKYMLDTVKALGVDFRAHIKTHKTIELTKHQVGKHSNEIRLLVSTVSELEHLSPWLLESIREGKEVNVIYGLPIAPSNIPRLARIARLLGPGTVSFLVDHVQQIQALDAFAKSSEAAWPGSMSVLIKVDTGYHRAGVAPSSKSLAQIASAVSNASHVSIVGIYAHMGHSYSSSSPSDAMSFLKAELSEAVAGAEALLEHLPEPDTEKLIISIGATPTATATQSLQSISEGSEVAKLISRTKERFQLEIHAGVYPVLDMQQLATSARPRVINEQSRLTTDNIGIRVMVEVASVYEEREKLEALIAAGSIVLGREPCKSYSGWGVVTPWTQDGNKEQSRVYDPSSDKTGWIVGRISQEHGILTWEGPPVGIRQLEVGEKILIWPNHACMAGPNFGYYLVVDSDRKGEEDVVTDVWVRCRGW